MFTHEIQYYKNIYNSVQNAYKIKDIALMGILDNLQLNGKILNWGIMRLAGDVGILNAKYILIGIDLQGMNMPIRLHIPKDLLVDWVRQNSTTNTIHLYAGSEDFHVYFENGEFHQGTNWITSPILIPSTERDKKNILKKMIDFPMDLYSHLAYVNGATDFPEHLKTDEIITKKGKKSIRKIFKREYINIFTGEIVNEDKLKQLKKGDAER